MSSRTINKREHLIHAANRHPASSRPNSTSETPESELAEGSAGVCLWPLRAELFETLLKGGGGVLNRMRQATRGFGEQ